MSSPISLAEMAERARDSRASARTNMFLGAWLQGDGFFSPVKVRNMSASGALAEGAAVPEEGSAVRLVRGGLSVPACVAWSENGRCGLRFAALVTVSDWLAPPQNREQQRVDEVVRLVKAGAIPIGPGRESSLAPAQLNEELRRVCMVLEKIGDSLSGNEAILATHGPELQNLDICAQTIATVADLLGTDCPGKAERLASLRLSLDQAHRSRPSSPRPA